MREREIGGVGEENSIGNIESEEEENEGRENETFKLKQLEEIVDEKFERIMEEK